MPPLGVMALAAAVDQHRFWVSASRVPPFLVLMSTATRLVPAAGSSLFRCCRCCARIVVAACAVGAWAVTHQAQEVHCSRQSVYDHAQKVHAAVAAEHSGGPSREQLIQKNQALRKENTQLWNWLSLTIEFLLVKQYEFSAVDLALGLSLTQIAVLLALLLGAKAAYIARFTLGLPHTRYR